MQAAYVQWDADMYCLIARRATRYNTSGLCVLLTHTDDLMQLEGVDSFHVYGFGVPQLRVASLQVYLSALSTKAEDCN